MCWVAHALRSARKVLDTTRRVRTSVFYPTPKSLAAFHLTRCLNCVIFSDVARLLSKTYFTLTHCGCFSARGTSCVPYALMPRSPHGIFPTNHAETDGFWCDAHVGPHKSTPFSSARCALMPKPNSSFEVSFVVFCCCL